MCTKKVFHTHLTTKQNDLSNAFVKSKAKRKRRNIKVFQNGKLLQLVMVKSFPKRRISFPLISPQKSPI